MGWTAPANDAAVAGYELQWRISDAGQDWSSWSSVSGGATARATTVGGLTNGTTYQFAVRAVDGQGMSLSVSNLVSATPAAVPSAPVVTATGGDGQVVLRWTSAAANGSLIKRYELRWRVADSGHGWPEWSSVSSTVRDTTVTGLPNGTPYQFGVRAVNGLGAGSAGFDTATPREPGSRTVSFAAASYQAHEGGDAVSVGVSLSPAASATVSIPVVVSADKGTESGDYTVSGLTEGSVEFASGASSASFSLVANEDGDTDDETLRVSFGTLPSGVVVGTRPQATVRLLDDDAPNPAGVVSLSSQSPQVGTQLTAELTDLSGGISRTTWQWQRRLSPAAAWQTITRSFSETYRTESGYTPSVDDVGYQLRAMVSYTDRHGSNQRAASTATGSVPAPLGSVSLSSSSPQWAPS